MSITVAAAKDKGRRLQQWVCQMISDLTGHPWGQDQPIESRPMGQNGVDIRLESHVLNQFPFSVECKSQESWNVHSWIEQAKENQLKNTTWLVVGKRSRQTPVVMMDGEVFFSLLKCVDFQEFAKMVSSTQKMTRRGKGE